MIAQTGLRYLTVLSAFVRLVHGNSACVEPEFSQHFEIAAKGSGNSARQQAQPTGGAANRRRSRW